MWPLEHVGLALAVSLASWLNVWYLERRLRRHLGKWRDFLGRSVPFVLLSLGVGLGAWGVWQFCPVRPKLVSLLLIPAWAWLYVRAARLLDLEEAHLFHEAVLGRLLRRLSGPGTGS
jgi:putative peptidoglycan lipid II flippase